MFDYEKLKALVEGLSKENGPSGNEYVAAEYAKNKLEEYMPVSVDALGNIRGENSGRGIHILLDAHIDQIGMIVTSIDETGFLMVDKCGGMDIRILAAHEVTVWGKQPIFGVVTSTPPHLSKKEDEKRAKSFNELSIDIGMSREKAINFVAIGDRVTLKGSHTVLLGNKICGPAFDDRAGVAVILRCLEILKEKQCHCHLSVLFSVQEETGGSGSKAGSFSAAADESIAVDVSFALAPDIPKEKCGNLGKGPMIGISPTLDNAMYKKLKNIAETIRIPFQLEVMGGRTGTNADEIQTSGKGTKVALLSIPLKNMHTCVEIIDLEDVENTARLMSEYILERSGSNA